jgi:hypothetical protein
VKIGRRDISFVSERPDATLHGGVECAPSRSSRSKAFRFARFAKDFFASSLISSFMIAPPHRRVP